MKALVTGAAGFIGSHLAEALVKKGYEVVCLVRKTSDLHWIDGLNVRLLFTDLSDIESCGEALSGHDIIFHIAGLTRGSTERDFFAANAENTGRLLKAVYERNPSLRRFLYLSSLAAVGPCSPGMPVRETSVPHPVSWYGRSKLAGEQAVMEYRDRMPVTIIRPPAVYGPRDRDFFMLFRMIGRGVYPCWGRSSYSLLFIDDLIQGIIAAAESSSAAGEIYFLTDATVYTNDDVAREISGALGVHPVRLPLPRAALPLLAFLSQKFSKDTIVSTDRINDFRYSCWTCDPTKAREVLDFQAKVPLRQGILWTADWYRIHRWI